MWSVSWRGRFVLAPRLSLEPRVGGFYWDATVSASAPAERIELSRRGGGFTVGMGAAYRLWRGLSLGIGVDHYRGAGRNLATLYGCSLEWRFGGDGPGA